MGLFGGGPAEKVGVDDLLVHLNKAFNLKLDVLDRKGAAILSRVDASMKMFIAACDELEALDAEPNIEFAFGGRVNYLKGLKNSYALALKNAIASREREGESYTVYGRYRAELEELDSTMTKILQTNLKFKHILSAYGNELKGFKRHYESLEQLRDDLKREIESRTGEFREYEAVLLEISELHRIRDESGRLAGELATIRASVEASTAFPAADLAALKAQLSAASAQARSASERLAATRAEIAIAVQPIERAAKKFDYSSGSMLKISPIAEDPAAQLVDGHVGYQDFLRSVDAMGGKLSSGELEVSGKDRVMQSVYRIMGGEVEKQIVQARALAQEKDQLEAAARAMTAEINILSSAGESRSRLQQRTSEIERIRVQLSAEASDRARSIERLFSKHYRKKIEVML